MNFFVHFSFLTFLCCYSLQAEEFPLLPSHFEKKGLTKTEAFSPLLQFTSSLESTLLQESKCSKAQLLKNEDYIRYTFRLLILSFLYESLEDHQNLAAHLGKLQGSCQFDWAKLFQQCRPQTSPMQKFCQQAPIAILKQSKPYRGPPLTDEDLQELWQQYSSADADSPSNKGGVSWSLLLNFADITEPSRLKIQQGLSKLCALELQLFTKICSEKDLLFGLSSIPDASKVLGKANTLAVINREGKGLECMERFIREKSQKEVIDAIIPLLFTEVLAKQNKERDLSQLQGKLYLPGALDEFEQKGLTLTIFTSKPVPTPLPTAIPVPTPTRPKVSSKIVEAPKPVPARIILPTPTPGPLSIPTAIPLSHFETMYALAMNSEMAQQVDLKILVEEAPFDKETVQRFDELLASYKTLNVLKKLKANKQLGDRDHPVGLTFIKYLLTAGHYQALFNLVQAVGKEFYITNDLEEKTVPVKVHLYAPSGSASWRMEILPD